MSYTIFPYLVDLDQLRAIYGSNNMALLGELDTAFADRFEEDEGSSVVLDFGSLGSGNEWVRVPNESLEEGLPRLRQALRELITGEIQSEDGVKHMQALELRCEHLGIALPNDHFVGLNSRAFGILEQISGINELIDSYNSPMPIPPTWGVVSMWNLTAKEAARRLAQFDIVTFPAVTIDPEWIIVMQEQYRFWLQESVKSE
jgi:hypothetical protein